MPYLSTRLPTPDPPLPTTPGTPPPTVARFRETGARETAVRLLGHSLSGHPEPASRPAGGRPAGAREALPGCWDDFVSRIGPGVSE